MIKVELAEFPEFSSIGFKMLGNTLGMNSLFEKLEVLFPASSQVEILLTNVTS